MTDPLHISLNSGKIPDLDARREYDHLIQQIQNMNPQTAYVVVQGYVVPMLNRLQENFLSLAGDKSELQSPIALASSNAINFQEFAKGLDKIKKSFKEVEERIENLKKNSKEILDLLIDEKDKKHTKITDKKNGLWPSDKGGTFGNFYHLAEFLKKKSREITTMIKDVEKHSPNSSLLKQLKQLAENLEKKIPPPSNKWNKKESKYNGKIWVRKEANGYLWVVSWKGDASANETFSKNSVGLLEMVQNQRKFNDYMSNITKSLKEIEKFSSTKEFHFLKLKELDTQAAFMYLITVIFPFLQNKSAKELKKQGDTMKAVSKAFDKWNSIQDLINDSLKKGAKQDAAAASKLHNKIKDIVREIKESLDGAKLPPSADSLIKTMKELSDKLVSQYPKDFFKVAKDSDQTAFKAYMDNLAQGITALTSISNMAQQQVQIATQYHNSLLGLQKNAFDSINKVAQLATKTPNY